MPPELLRAPLLRPVPLTPFDELPSPLPTALRGALPFVVPPASGAGCGFATVRLDAGPAAAFTVPDDAAEVRGAIVRMPAGGAFESAG